MKMTGRSCAAGGLWAAVLMVSAWAVLPGGEAVGQNAKPKVTHLFNGKDLTGWVVHEGDKEVWKVKDGVLVCTGKGGGWLLSNQEYSDGSFYVEYRISTKGNSGLALRAPLKGDPAYEGMEIQILDDDAYKGLRSDQYTAAVYGVVGPEKKNARAVGQWNVMTVTFKGSIVIVNLNGENVLSRILTDLPNYREIVKTHPGLLRKKGRVGLQSHTGQIEFRKVAVVTREP